MNYEETIDQLNSLSHGIHEVLSNLRLNLSEEIEDMKTEVICLLDQIIERLEEN